MGIQSGCIAAIGVAFSVLYSQMALAVVEIKHKPVKKAKSNTRIALVSTVDGTEISDVRAYFKSASDTRFFYVPMNSNENEYTGILPAPEAGVGSIEYLIYAVGGEKEYVKTARFIIAIKDDEEALERLREKEPTDIEINIDRLQQLHDLAKRAGRPDKALRVEIRTETPGVSQPANIPGFNDYMVLNPGTPAAGGAGLAAATTVSASAGIATSTLIMAGAAAAGGVGLVSSGGSSSSSIDINLVGSWGNGGTSWNITSDQGGFWSGTSTAGGCGDTITIDGTRSGLNISADFGNAQGAGFLNGTVNSSGNSMTYNYQYNSGICSGDSGTATLTRN